MRTPSAFLVAERLVAAGVAADVAARAQVAVHGRRLLARVRTKASGRPGPNIITGAYLARMELTFIGSNRYQHRATVGNTSPQTRRLEFGFVGADSLGRVYNQPPFPHFGPAADEIGGEFTDSLSMTVGQIVEAA